MRDDRKAHTSAKRDAGEAYPKQTGVAHFFAAARYSMQGFERLIAESAFRHELIGFIIGLVLFAIVGASALEFLGFVILVAVLFAVEAINTAIEELVDRISPEISTVGKHAKDLGSFAVFCLLIANGAYMIVVLFF
ncbi:diacylglycerol kinase [Pseudomonas sp. R2.Fl]|nr:diacylglycerol kinase [Pseudomonas sp. R2.Fl]